MSSSVGIELKNRLSSHIPSTSGKAPEVSAYDDDNVQFHVIPLASPEYKQNLLGWSDITLYVIRIHSIPDRPLSERVTLFTRIDSNSIHSILIVQSLFTSLT